MFVIPYAEIIHIKTIILFYLNLIPSEDRLDFDYHSKGLGLFCLTPLFVHSFGVTHLSSFGVCLGEVLSYCHYFFSLNYV